MGGGTFKPADPDADETNDTFLAVTGVQTVCFIMDPKTNNTVGASSETQICKVTLALYGDYVPARRGSLIFIYFVVP